MCNMSLLQIYFLRIKTFLRFFSLTYVKYRIYNEKIIISIVLYFIAFLSHSLGSLDRMIELAMYGDIYSCICTKEMEVAYRYAYWEMSKILIIQVKNEIKKFLNKVYLNIFYQKFLTSYFFSELVYIYIY